jgi:tRNA(fMet)-specific endonuclease VapC
VGILIDASVLIAYERGGLDISARVSGRDAEDPFYLSVITVSELLHGVHRADSPRRRAKRTAFVEGVLDHFPILNIDLPTARLHAEIWASLAAAGRSIGAHDAWLAAACVAHGLTLVTANAREFRRVEGLEVEVWSG